MNCSQIIPSCKKLLAFNYNTKRVGPIGTTVFLVLLLAANTLLGQQRQPVKWNFTSKKVSNTDIILEFTATLDNGWHIYSQHLDPGGPIPTKFDFNYSDEYSLVGEVEEKSQPVKFFDNTFQINITYFSNVVVFHQRVKLKSQTAIVNGKISCMICTDENCLPATDKIFSFAVNRDRYANGSN